MAESYNVGRNKNSDYQYSLHLPAHRYLKQDKTTRGVRTADADIRGPGSADFLANTDGPRIAKATSIVCRTNLEQKCQCTSSQQFEN